jgi:NAD(P) transhydrogenase subunit alpha
VTSLRVAVPAEIVPGERRVALTPEGARGLVGAGLQIRVERGAGLRSGIADEEYERAGAQLAPDARSLLASADVVLKVQPPRSGADGPTDEIGLLRRGSALLGFLRPLDEPALAARLAARGVTAFAMELVPRVTRAQAMDALSSQATVAGYRAVLLAAGALPRMFPMLVTAAGTVPAARVFVIGAGVAGLQAIATAKRLGAIVEGYDTRRAAAEQIQSLGARVFDPGLDAGQAEDAGGYARAQSEDFYLRQRQAMAQRAAASDVVITTALVPGRRAPLLLDEEGVKGMRAGSVVVDLAAPNGGNCACTAPGETVQAHGVTVMGPLNPASDLPANASQMYSRNVVALLRHLVRDGRLDLDLEDEITRGALLAHDGSVTSEAVRKLLGGPEPA